MRSVAISTNFRTVPPYGTLEYKKRGTYSDGTPAYSAFQKLSPNQARMKSLTDRAGIKYGETANNQMNAIQGTLSKPLNFDSLGAAPQVDEAMRAKVAQSMYDRLNPQFDRDQDRLETQLINQGLQRGSEAWNNSLDDIYRAKNDARLAIDNQSLNQMAQMYGLQESGRNARINEMSMLRSQPLNELAAMLTGSQVQNPQFVNTPVTNVGATDVTGPIYANYNAAMQNYQNRRADNNGFLSGLFSLGSAAIPFIGGAVGGGSGAALNLTPQWS